MSKAIPTIVVLVVLPVGLARAKSAPLENADATTVVIIIASAPNYVPIYKMMQKTAVRVEEYVAMVSIANRAAVRVPVVRSATMCV